MLTDSSGNVRRECRIPPRRTEPRVRALASALLLVALGGCSDVPGGSEAQQAPTAGTPIDPANSTGVPSAPGAVGPGSPSGGDVPPGAAPLPTAPPGSPSGVAQEPGPLGPETPVPGATAQPGEPAALVCDEPSAPSVPLRRITRYEYNNSVRDLLLVTSRPADSLPGEEEGSGFGNDSVGVSRLLIDGYRTVAQQIAAEVVADADKFAAVTACDPVADAAGCKQSFLEGYLTRAFRRPPDAEELLTYQQTFERGEELGGDFGNGVRAVIERSLQSPQFLYRIELGQTLDAARGLARPTGYELATRLSYLIWSSTPDTALLDAAASGRLDTDEGVLAEAQRMLGDDRAKDSLRYFHGKLFGHAGLDFLERDRELYPAFQPGMGSLFRQETEHFLDHVIWDGAGDLATLFTAPYTFVNQPLATFYGIPGVTGDAFVQAPVDTAQRMGLLTQASILTLTTPGSRTDPVVRGKWLYTKMLCGTVPDPPTDVPELPEAEPGQSVRERLEQHRADPNCATCHQLMDPLGLPFEHYDGVGLWRDTDNGAEIDVTGAIPITDVAGPFEGALEFSQRLAESQDVRDCYVGRYLTYAYGRALTETDECSRAEAETAFHAAEGNIQALMLAVTQTDGFLLRQVVPTEQ